MLIVGAMLRFAKVERKRKEKERKKKERKLKL